MYDTQRRGGAGGRERGEGDGNGEKAPILYIREKGGG